MEAPRPAAASRPAALLAGAADLPWLALLFPLPPLAAALSALAGGRCPISEALTVLLSAWLVAAVTARVVRRGSFA